MGENGHFRSLLVPAWVIPDIFTMWSKNNTEGEEPRRRVEQWGARAPSSRYDEMIGGRAVPWVSKMQGGLLSPADNIGLSLERHSFC